MSRSEASGWEVEDPSRLSGRESLALAAVLVAFIVGLVILVADGATEPYHIDELRQVSSYSHSLSGVAAASFSQEQPPLDALLNSFSQQAIGVGDLQQRLLSIIFGGASLLLIGLLAVRSGLGLGAGAVVLTMAVSPVVIAVTAYARPYALPTFLTLLLLLAIDVWLAERRLWTIPVMAAAAMLLPLSRALEPNIVLAATALVLLGMMWRASADRFRGSPMVPMLVVVAGLLFVGAPVLLRLRADLAAYTGSGGITSWDQLGRLLSDFPSQLGRAVPWWPLFVGAAVVALVSPLSRDRLKSMWWLWVLASVPLGFAVMFFARAAIGQPYATRYTYSFWPVLGVLVGLATVAVVDSVRRERWAAAVVAAAVVVLPLGAMTVATVRNLAADGRPDFEAAGTSIESLVSQETTVAFDQPAPIGTWRTGLAGRGRYFLQTRNIFNVVEIVSQPELVKEDASVAIFLLGTLPEIDGWERTEIDRFVLLVPDADASTRSDLVQGFLEVGESLGPDRGGVFFLAAASLLDAAGESDDACSAVTALTGKAKGELLSRIVTMMEKTGLSELSKSCTD